MRQIKKIIVIGVLSAAIPAFAQAKTELAVHKKRLSDRVLVVWTGDYMQTIDVLAFATQKGIVVIDSSLIRSLDLKVRRVIEEEFGRNDFKYLINTHHHHDHTAGNQVYSDAMIVGHKTLPKGMKEELTGDGLVALIDKFKGMLEQHRAALKELDPASGRFKFEEEFIICLKLAIEELSSGFVPVFPSIVFEKNMTLDMGDMTFQLYSWGGTHSKSDIAVFVPEEGMVALGDVTPDGWMPYVRKEWVSAFPATIEHHGRIIESGIDLKHINMSHSDMDMSVKTFIDRYRYLNTLWQGLKKLHEQGLTLEDAKKEYTIEADFPFLMEKRREARGIDLHEHNVEVIWAFIADSVRTPAP